MDKRVHKATAQVCRIDAKEKWSKRAVAAATVAITVAVSCIAAVAVIIVAARVEKKPGARTTTIIVAAVAAAAAGSCSGVIREAFEEIQRHLLLTTGM